MDTSEYGDYLKSDEWKAIAAERLKIDEYRCVMCGSRGTVENPLQVHHMKYTHIGNERPYIWTELLTLCYMCHKRTHAMMCRKTAPNKYGWKDQYFVPAISIYTLTGEAIEAREVGKLHE